MKPFSRRTLLASLGLAGASYFAPSLSGADKARAGGAKAPPRVVFFYTSQGTLKKEWAPTGLGGFGAPSEKAWDLGPLHGPLAPWKQKLNFLDGLDMVSSRHDPTAPKNGHIAGETHSLVADSRATPVLGGNVSIDQYIAKALNHPSPVTAFPSLELGVPTSPNNPDSQVPHPSYSGSAQVLPYSLDPREVFDRLFPSLGAPTDQAKELASRKSVLDYVRQQTRSVSALASGVDRARLEAHEGALRDLEARLDKGAGAACTTPDKSIVAGVRDKSLGDQAFVVNVDAQLRLIRSALACDLTRVVTLSISQMPDSICGYHPVAPASDLHDLFHKTQPDKAVLSKNPEALGIIRSYHVELAKKFASLLQMLDEIPEPDGTTLLDNTVVVWCGQIAGGDHSLDHVPYVLAGGGAAGLKTGRYLKMPRTPSGGGSDVGLPHNDLFVSLANLMGVPTTTFGNPAVCTGPLAGL